MQKPKEKPLPVSESSTAQVPVRYVYGLVAFVVLLVLVVNAIVPNTTLWQKLGLGLVFMVGIPFITAVVAKVYSVWQQQAFNIYNVLAFGFLFSASALLWVMGIAS